MPTDSEVDDDTAVHSFNGGFAAFDLNPPRKIAPHTRSLYGVRVCSYESLFLRDDGAVFGGAGNRRQEPSRFGGATADLDDS